MNPPHFQISRAIADGQVRSVSWQELAHLVTRAANCLVAALAEPTVAAGLNEPRVAVLEALDGCQPELCTQTGLARRLLLSESNLSTLLDRMQHDGFIERERSRADRRKTLIRMTERGASGLLRARAARSASVARMLGDETSEPLNATAELLLQMIQQVEAHLDPGRMGTPGTVRAGLQTINHKAQSQRAPIDSVDAPFSPIAEA